MFLDLFASLSEVRADNHRYPLPHLVFIAATMTLCGANDWNGVASLAKRKSRWLGKYIPLPYGTPSNHTFRRVFARLDPDEFRECFIKWVSLIVERTEGEVIAIEGGADYLLAVKGNQPTLYDDIKLFLDDLTTKATLPDHAKPQPA